MIPYITLSQESEDLRRAPRKKGIELGRHLILKKSQKPYTNSKSFPESVKSTMRPHVARICPESGIEQSEDVTSDAIDLLSRARAPIGTFAAHTTQIFKLLDLTLWDLPIGGELSLLFRDLGWTPNLAYSVYTKTAKTFTPPNVWAAFQVIEVRFYPGSVLCRIVFRNEKLRESKRFIELWKIDYPLKSLTPRRRNSRVEWINKLFKWSLLHFQFFSSERHGDTARCQIRKKC
jgi:hypothetical protein